MPKVRGQYDPTVENTEGGFIMPRGDRTGPAGAGSMTGRAAGYCAGFDVPGYMNTAAGRGFGAGFGQGRGFRGCGFAGYGRRNRAFAAGAQGTRFGGYAAPYRAPDSELEKQALKNQAEALKSELDLIRKRLSEIEADTAAK